METPYALASHEQSEWQDASRIMEFTCSKTCFGKADLML